MTRLECKCPICGESMDWYRGYGRDAHCCGKTCHDEFEWRRTLAILGKEYYPDPRSTQVDEPVIAGYPTTAPTE